MDVINGIELYKSEHNEIVVKQWIQHKEIGFGKVMQPLRLCLVGGLKGVHLFDIMEIIGKKETIQRIENIIERLM